MIHSDKKPLQDIDKRIKDKNLPAKAFNILPTPFFAKFPCKPQIIGRKQAAENNKLLPAFLFSYGKMPSDR